MYKIITQNSTLKCRVSDLHRKPPIWFQGKKSAFEFLAGFLVEFLSRNKLYKYTTLDEKENETK